ncbi:UPF0041-domain-containing protein [Daldinia vernicosa]|uniref:UPF0041-domain-containing protein n=1 Tax=Daldinia vernicosa TaxID=114800 RepID=UPI0020072D0B|nr:UPF0041-domain-containing protein [Daldinia vernicosa]KAI0848431.1 UPF0041-domain-containing protein [Daldinia vernicosa]
MPPATTLFRAARPVFQQSALRPAFRSNFAPKTGRRFASTATTGEGAAQSWFQRMWNSPIGIKTVHFWAPVMKWAIVIAGISDFARPPDKLSLTQNAALTATGLIWTRWCFVIKPRNVLLATVNFFLGCVGIIQVCRILMWRRSQKDAPAAAESGDAQAKEAVKA